MGMVEDMLAACTREMNDLGQLWSSFERIGRSARADQRDRDFLPDRPIGIFFGRCRSDGAGKIILLESRFRLEPNGYIEKCVDQMGPKSMLVIFLLISPVHQATHSASPANPDGDGNTLKAGAKRAGIDAATQVMKDGCDRHKLAVNATSQ